MFHDLRYIKAGKLATNKKRNLLKTYLYLHSITVPSRLDLNHNGVFSDVEDFSGTSGKHWDNQKCISAKLNGPFSDNTLNGLEFL